MASLEEGRAGLDNDNDDNNSLASFPSSSSSLSIEDLQRDHLNTSSERLARQGSAKKQSVRRLSTAQSLDTGKSGEVVTMKVKVLEDSTREPMTPTRRRKKEFKHLFKAAAETVIAENNVKQATNNDENHGGSDLFRNLTHSVVTRRRFQRLGRGEENEPKHYHGRLMVQASRHGDGEISEEDESSSNSKSSNSSADTRQANNQDATETTSRRSKKKKKDKSPHYRLALHKGPKGNIVVRTLRAFGISAGSTGIYDSTGEGGGGCRCFCISPNEIVTGYLRWSFRTNFSTYFLSAALSFFGLTIIFALLCWWSGTNYPHCIHVNGVEFGTQTNWGNFLDAYSLSWTTFSTVGYGLIFPSTSVIEGNHADCYGIYILTTLEAYVGILFASLTGAIVFSKITRVRSQAQVVFSDPIVIKYGSGVHGEEDAWSSANQSGNADDGNKDGKLQNENYPFPVLEFRVVNRLNSVIKGEIMDCVMSVVASIDERNACRDVQKAAAHIRRRKGKKRGREHRRASTKSLGTTPTHHPTIKESKAMSFGDFINRSESMGSTANDSSSAVVETNVTRRRKHTAFDEEMDGKLCPRRIFSKLEIDGGPDHPFFKRVWIARHTIDLHSPLLTNEARYRIRLNGGRWPKELASHDAVRKSISFDQILVSFSGTSNADANSVYAQKVYEYGDMNVGYTFVSMLYRDLRDGSIKCDLTLLNNVYEQCGGGGEPLQGVEDEKDFAEHLSGIMVL